MKPREYWLDITPPRKSDCGMEDTYGDIYSENHWDDLVHVIEYSAHEKLKAAAKDVLYAKNSAERTYAEFKLKELLEDIE